MLTHRRFGIPAFAMVIAVVLAACGGGGGATGSPAATVGGGDSPAATDTGESPAATAPDETAGEAEAPCPDEAPQGDGLMVGGVTDVGQLEDRSFNEAGWCGTRAGAADVGGTADVIVTQDPADYQANIEEFIAQGFNVIVTYGFALREDTANAALAHPDVEFIGVDQPVCVDEEGVFDPDFTCAGDPAEVLPNYQGLVFAEAQAGYLAGIVAANITETDVIGTIGGIETIPAVTAYIRGYENGARSVNPDIEVLVDYVSEDITRAFDDPATGASIAEQMIGQDADVIFQVAGLSGQGALEVVCDEGLYGIGVDVDQALSLPDLAGCIVTSAEKKIVEATRQAIVRIDEGTNEGGTIVNDATNGGIGLAPFHEFEDLITDDIRAQVDEAFAAMESGELDADPQP